MSDSTRPERILYALAAIAVVIGALKVASGLLVPALLALFIAIVCTEPMYWMVSKGLPRWLAIIIVILILLGLSSMMPLVISGSFVQFNAELPIYQERLNVLLAQSSDWLTDYGYDMESLRTIFDPAAALEAVGLPPIAHTGVPSVQLQGVALLDPEDPASVYPKGNA